MSSRPELRLDWCSHKAARYAVEHWHYSGSMPTPPHVFIGVWEDGQFIGVVIFSRGAARRGPEAFGIGHVDMAELTRVALSDHHAETSRIVAIALKMLRRRCPGTRLVVSYADPNHGHHGGIYQAGGWLFLGQSGDTTEYVGPNGKQWHSRMISPTGRKKVYGQYRPVYKPDQCTPVRLRGKLKYLMPLDAEMREKIAPLAKPYPKREPRVSPLESEGTGTTGQGRCDATDTLHIENADG